MYNVLVEHTGYSNVAELDFASWKYSEQVYAGLYRKRLTIGELDILIAAFCIVNGYTLVTDNTRHFENIDVLKIVNWAQ